MKCWWVNQGDRYREERKLGCLWSPMLGGDGRTIPHWEAMKEIQKGDIIFHYCKGSIKAYSYALTEAEVKEKPNTKGHSNEFQSTEGYFVKVEITDLYQEISVRDIPEEYKATESGIFASNGFPKQGYLFPVEKNLKDFLMSQISAHTGLNWRDFLKEWRQDGSIITPPDLEKLRNEFNRRFPKENLSQLTLEDYALGRSEFSPDNFCHFIEFKSKKLGSIAGGSASKHGVYWSKAENN